MASMMKKKPRTLKVVCNPFCAVHDIGDGELRCVGAFPHEPPPPSSGLLEDAVRHVGARRVVAEVSPANHLTRVLAVHERAFEFTHEAQTVNRSEYYRRALIDGAMGERALFAADEETHKWAGLPGPFVDPLRRIAQLSMEREGLLPAHFGELLEPEPVAAADAEPETSEGKARLEAAHEEGVEKHSWDAILAPHKAAIKADHERIATENAKAAAAFEAAQSAKAAAAAQAGEEPTHHDA